MEEVKDVVHDLGMYWFRYFRNRTFGCWIIASSILCILYFISSCMQATHISRGDIYAS